MTIRKDTTGNLQQTIKAGIYLVQHDGTCTRDGGPEVQDLLGYMSAFTFSWVRAGSYLGETDPSGSSLWHLANQEQTCSVYRSTPFPGDTAAVGLTASFCQTAANTYDGAWSMNANGLGALLGWVVNYHMEPMTNNSISFPQACMNAKRGAPFDLSKMMAALSK